MATDDLKTIIIEDSSVSSFLDLYENNKDNSQTSESIKLKDKDKKTSQNIAFISSIFFNFAVLKLTDSYLLMFILCGVYLVGFHLIYQYIYEIIKKRKLKKQKEEYPNAFYILGENDAFKEISILKDIEAYYDILHKSNKIFVKNVISSSNFKKINIETAIKEILLNELSNNKNYSYIYKEEKVITNFITTKYHYDLDFAKKALIIVKESIQKYKKNQFEIDKELENIKKAKKEKQNELINNVIQNL